jgi:hypothetical protein
VLGALALIALVVASSSFLLLTARATKDVGP